MSQDQSLGNTPFIPDGVYRNLPPYFQDLLEDVSNKRERDVLFLSSAVVVSGCLNRISGNYMGKKITPHLYGFIVAPAASGKSIAKYARTLGGPIHKDRMKDSKKLFLPGNTSAAAFYNALYINGGEGVLFETEADTLSGSLKQDWGNFSDGLRKAWHNETISVLRKTDKLHIEIDFPKLAILLTGTPGQVSTLIPTPENGLFSRFFYYPYEQEMEWRSAKPCDECPDKTSTFWDAGILLQKASEVLGEKELRFNLNSSQYERFDEYFSSKVSAISETGDSDESSVVYRMGHICFKIAMIFSVLRIIDDIGRREQIDCEDVDLDSALLLTDTLLDYSSVVLRLIRRSKTETRDNKCSFLRNLPLDFTLTVATEIGLRKLNIKPRTVRHYLKSLVMNGRLERKEHGSYRKLDTT